MIIEPITVIYRQADGHNCGLYAVANATNDGKIITPERLAEGYKGQTINLLNEYLKEDGVDFYIETIYKSIFRTTLPKEVKPLPEDSDQALPLLMTVVHGDTDINHMVALRVFSNGIIHVFDSLRKNVICTDFEHINEIYPKIFGLFAFCKNDHQDNRYVMLSYD